jgi:hypothetical protein
MTKPAQFVAWMLTPVIVWVGAFSMGWMGAWLGGKLTWLVVGGVVGGLAGLLGWSYLILFLKKRNVVKTTQGKTESD